MGLVNAGFSISLDGFVAGPHDSPEQPLGDGGDGLFAWYGAGDTEYTMPSGEYTFKVSAASAKLLDKAIKTSGALVTGRRTFEISHAWNGQHPMDVPVFVVTSEVPEGWPKDGVPFTFVTDGVESAIKQAKVAAGDKDVTIGAPSITQQAIKLGLLDELQLDLVPLLIGGGVRLLDNIGAKPIELQKVNVIEGTGVTHLIFRIIK
jgi:dihydrofolate reductase